MAISSEQKQLSSGSSLCSDSYFIYIVSFLQYPPETLLIDVAAASVSARKLEQHYINSSIQKRVLTYYIYILYSYSSLGFISQNYSQKKKNKQKDTVQQMYAHFGDVYVLKIILYKSHRFFIPFRFILNRSQPLKDFYFLFLSLFCIKYKFYSTFSYRANKNQVDKRFAFWTLSMNITPSKSNEIFPLYVKYLSFTRCVLFYPKQILNINILSSKTIDSALTVEINKTLFVLTKRVNIYLRDISVKKLIKNVVPRMFDF